MNHVGVATGDLDHALAFYRDVLGMTPTSDETIEDQGVRVVFLATARGTAPGQTTSTEIELLAPTHDNSPVAQFLARRGPGLHHVAFEVDDLAAALADCRARGLRLVDETPRRGARGHLVAFLHPGAADGVLVELVQIGG